MKNVNFSLLVAVLAVLLAVFSCRPVVAIGWQELLFLLLLVAVFVGPSIYRFLRRIENYHKHRKK